MNSTAEGIGAESGIVLFPNPVNDFLTVTAPANLKARHFVIADVAGRELRRFSLDGVRTAVSMEGLTTGIYLFRVLDFKGNLVDSGTLVKE
ncbi:MAG: T9SS type A sorting domain-containing protein [Bacteroidetes bacterium]|nr:T9SS type A sorting domain-containing protein [Bacteroidota bacterium]